MHSPTRALYPSGSIRPTLFFFFKCVRACIGHDTTQRSAPRPLPILLPFCAPAYGMPLLNSHVGWCRPRSKLCFTSQKRRQRGSAGKSRSGNGPASLTVIHFVRQRPARHSSSAAHSRSHVLGCQLCDFLNLVPFLVLFKVSHKVRSRCTIVRVSRLTTMNLMSCRNRRAHTIEKWSKEGNLLHDARASSRSRLCVKEMMCEPICPNDLRTRASCLMNHLLRLWRI